MTTTISRALRTQHVVAARRVHVRARPTLPRDTLDLPRALSSFVGGQEQVEAVVARLRATRLVTLTGWGGVGKTRLAQQIVQTVHAEYERCAWASLGSIVDAAQIGESLVAALGGGSASSSTRVETLVQGIGRHHLLLVLDNCEHLIEGCADVVTRILESCPGVSLLATSREPLNLPGEVAYRVKPLALPNPVEPPDQQMQSAAAQLFVERARARESDLQLTREACTSVATICETVHGTPLAIELAASWVSTMTVSEIAARLTEDVLALRAASPRGVLARQQSLRASLDWSHALLEHPAQRLLRGMAGLVGDFSLDDAVGLGAVEDLRADDVALLLDRLVGHSLVQATEQRSRMRYSLTAPVRAYYREQLTHASTHASLPETSCDSSRPEGATIDVLREWPRRSVPGSSRGRLRGLSERERDVVLLIASGRSNRQIADELVITKKTAEAHVSHILTKLGLSSRVQIATWSLQHGLVCGGGDRVIGPDTHAA